MVDSVTIESATGCNGSCIICPNQSKPRQPYFMPLSEFKMILEFFLSLKGVVLCGMYEPLLDPRLDEVLTIIQHVQPSAKVTIFTNGSLLSPNMRRVLLSHSNLKYLVVSIHGFTREVYESVMKGLSRNQVYDNVLNFLEEREAYGEGPHVSVSFVRVKQNVHELPAFRHFWAGKVDVVSDFEVCSWQGQVPVEQLYYEWPTHTRECPMFEKPLVIDAYGNIVLCCYNFTQNYGHVLKGGYEKWLNKQRLSSTYPLLECEKCNGWQHY